MSVPYQQLLTVQGAHDFSSLRVLDGNLETVAIGTGSLEVELPVGLYLVQSRQPGRSERRLAALEAAAPTLVEGFDPTVSPPLPALADPAIANAVQTATRRLPPAARGFARVVLCVQRSSNGFGGVRLLQPNGVVVIEPGKGAWTDLGPLGIASADLPSGTYGLEHELGSLGKRSACLRLEPGMETQVFIDHGDVGDPLRSIHMRKIGTGYEAGDVVAYARALAVVEGIATGRLALPRTLRVTPATETVKDPMLLLLGVYAVWHFDALSESELARAAGALAKVMPASPDAAVLDLALHGLGDGRRPLEAPPMLAFATERLLAMAVEQPVIQPGSWLADISLRLTSTGVWTRWEPETGVRRTQVTARRQIADIAWELRRQDPEPAEVARVAGLPQSLVGAFEASVKTAGRGVLGRAAGSAMLAARDVLSLLAGVLAPVGTALRAGLRANARRGNRTADLKRMLASLSLPADQQWYVDAKLMRMMSWQEQLSLRWSRFSIASWAVTLITAVFLIPAAALTGSGHAWRWVTLALAVILLAITIARLLGDPDQRWRSSAAVVRRLTDATSRFAHDLASGDFDGDERFQSLVYDIELATSDAAQTGTGLLTIEPVPAAPKSVRDHPAPADEPRAQPAKTADVSAAVTLGWQLAELYRLELRGPPDSIGDWDQAALPEQLELLARATHSTIVRLRGTIELPDLPSMDLFMLEASSTVGIERQQAISSLHAMLLRNLTAADFRLGKAYELGRGLADVTSGELAELASDRTESLLRWLDELGTALPTREARSVAISLQRWREWAADPPTETALDGALRRQGKLWRALLSGEQLGAEILAIDNYRDAARRLTRQMLSIQRVALLGLPVLTVLVAVLVLGGGALLIIGGTSYTAAGLTAVIVGALLAWRGIGGVLAELSDMLRAPIRASVEETVIADAITLLPVDDRRGYRGRRVREARSRPE